MNKLKSIYSTYKLQHKIEDNRKLHNVYARHAFAVASTKEHTQVYVAKAMGYKDHTSVIHALRMHEQNKGVRMYVELYNSAVKLLDYSENTEELEVIDYLRLEIQHLNALIIQGEEEKKRLENQIAKQDSILAKIRNALE